MRLYRFVLGGSATGDHEEQVLSLYDTIQGRHTVFETFITTRSSPSSILMQQK